MPAVTTTSTMSSSSPRNKKMAGPPPTSGIAQQAKQRPSLRYSLNHLGKALADAVGKESKSSAHVRSASAVPSTLADRSGSSSPSTRPSTQLGLRRPSVVGAFERPSLDAARPTQAQVRMRTMSAVGRGLPTQLKAAVLSSPKRASPTKAPPTTSTSHLPLTRRPSFMTKGALVPPAPAPVPVGTAKVAIRPKMSAPPRVMADDERPMEVKERKTDSPRAPPVSTVRARERVDSRASPVRMGFVMPGSTPKAGRASPSRNDQTPTAPKDDREKRRERREKDKHAAEEKKEAIEREKKAALERERAKLEAKKAEEQSTPSGHRTSGSTATLTSTSSIFTSASRSSTADSHTSGGSTVPKSKSKSKSNTAVFPRAAQTVVLTPPDDQDEDEDTELQTPMTRSRTATGSTQFGDVSSPAISRTLLASISAQTESPIMAPIDLRLRHAGSFNSLISSLPSSTLPSPVRPGTVTFPPPAPGLVNKFKDDTSDDEDWGEEGDVSALLETVISPLMGATPAMPRFTSKSTRSHPPETPSRPAGLPGRDALSYASPALPASFQRTRGDKLGKNAHRGPRESILSYDALVERSRLDEEDFEDMLRAPPPAVGLISPDMRPVRNLPRLTSIGPKRMNLGGMSDSEGEIEEEPEEQTVHVSSNAGQSISQVLFPAPGPSSPTRPKRDLAEKEKAWTAKEEAWTAKEESWEKQRTEWELERAQWEAERAHWKTQQTQWNAQRTLWNAQHSEWSGKQSEWESERSAWTTRAHQLESTVQAREVDIEALEHENGAHRAEITQRSEEHQLEIDALLKRLDGFQLQSQELRVAKERQAKYEAQARCTSALNAWTGVCASLRDDAASCAADRAALRVILSGLEAMVRCE
ncbi:hypothetical protein RSOL_447970 [Rhizoctonia solani AG-3 Rhs1AP]|uniref:Uncharacterized protein n=1 Tax=Rhizoctonia solani AG-3 Rhs1AP TaxID=1086054 RepID=X8JNK7_9AGAM|nr:hypothetical protein RSOL_447970 [Rhizoctonia solani AG-3 Rhs1AP]